MKKVIFLVLLIFVCLNSFAQSAFDKALSELSTDLADKLSLKGKKKTVVLYITDINKAPSVAGKYLADIISSNIVNNPGNFMVFDRDNLNGIAEINKLISEGYLDENKTKEIGRILSVETIIVGSYTVLSNSIKLSTKALDVTTAFVIASSLKDLPLDGDAGALLGINFSSSSPGNSNNNPNRGFNSPLNSNEQYNNPETVNRECEKNNTGDICFHNSSPFKINIHLTDQGGLAARQYDGTAEINEQVCFPSILAKSFVYLVYEYNKDGDYVPQNAYRRANILIEKCKSKSFTIK